MPPNDDAANAPATISRLAFSILAGQTFGAGIRLGIADFIADDTKTPSEVAEHRQAHPEATRRLLRAWAAMELLQETEPDHFSLTAAGHLLRTDRERSAAVTARLFTDPLITEALRRLDHSINTGETAFDEVFGTDFFAYIEQQPEVSEMFHAAMGQGTSRVAQSIAGRYDASRFTHVIDIGGGDGTLLAAILDANPTLRGTVFDSADGAASTRDRLRERGLGGRSDVAIGDFFREVPPGGDLYVIKSVIHDWNDDQCASILDNIREAIAEDGRLLIIEPILPDVVDGSIPPLMYLSDMNMLVNVGGRERTRADFEELCRRSGFTITEVISGPETMGFSLIEAAAA